MRLCADFGGNEVPFVVPDDSSVADAGLAIIEALRMRTRSELDLSSIKLLHRSTKGALKPSVDSTRQLSSLGVRSGDRIKVIGSTKQALHAVCTIKDDSRMLGIDAELARAARRKQRSRAAPVKLPSGPYVFENFHALARNQIPEASCPSPEAALAFLHQLAADPGIVQVMAQERFTVGCLSEMMPSDMVDDRREVTCLLGLNINKGQEIKLRLRTNDFEGFRKYEIIRQTLVHELTHNVWGDHDNNFKELNSRLLQECIRVSERFKYAHRLVEGELRDDLEDVSSRQALQEAHVLGGSPSAQPAAQAAAQSAQVRLQRQHEVSDTVARDGGDHVSSHLGFGKKGGMFATAGPDGATEDRVNATGADDSHPVEINNAINAAMSARSPDAVQNALRVVHRITKNILESPEEKRFQAVRRCNASFQGSVMRCPELECLLAAAGFVLEADNIWHWRSREKLAAAQLVKGEVERHLVYLHI